MGDRDLTTVRSRVVRVRQRDDGTYAVTLGMAPHVYWLLADRPPKVGQLLLVQARARSSAIEGGMLTVLEGGSLQVVPDLFARRLVLPQWAKACRAAATPPLFVHQIEGAAWLAERLSQGQGAILADSPGLGKTLQALVAVAAARRLPCIVVAPASVKRDWYNSVQQLRGDYKAHLIGRGAGEVGATHFAIVNYDLLRRREPQLARIGARSIIFDEAHLLKAHAPPPTHRAAVSTRLAHRVGCPLLLTGTPILNRAQELWRLLHIVDRAAWPSFTDFCKDFCTADEEGDEDPGRTVVTHHGEASRLDELHTRLGPVVLRRLKRDVLKTLPAKVRRSVRVSLDEVALAHYQAAERDVVAWLAHQGTGLAALRAARGKALVKMTALRKIAALGKLRGPLGRYLAAWFAAERRPLVIFGYHQTVIRGALAICGRMGLRCSSISGKDTGAVRARAVAAFNGGLADVFVAPIRSAGVGLNLQRRCRDVLFVERDWTPALLNQAEDRCHRLGSIGQVSVTYLDAEGTVDQHLAAVLDAKQRLIDSVVDDDDRASDGRGQTVETIEAVMTRLGGRSNADEAAR